MNSSSCFFLIFFSLFSLTFCSQISIPVSASSSILVNAKTGKVLFSKNPHLKHPPASVTKIATALYILNNVEDIDSTVRAHLECLVKIPKKIKVERKYEDPPYRLEPDGTSYGIIAGEVLSVKDLLYGMMLCSGNDASNVLAYHFSGGRIETFMENVNQLLESIGCINTKFFNPHGLHFPSHLSTARDLALLVAEAIKNPMFLEIVGSSFYERPKTNKQPARIIYTTNKLLKRGQFFYPKAFGIKSGYHSLAGYNLVAAAKDENRTLISIVLNCKDSAEAYRDTIRIFDAAFSEKKLTRHLLNAQESVFTMVLEGLKEPIKAALKEDLVIEYFPSEEEALSPEILWKDLTLPIKQGDVVGEVTVKNSQNIIIKKGEIFSLSNYQRGRFEQFYFEHKWMVILGFFSFLILASLISYKIVLVHHLKNRNQIS